MNTKVLAVLLVVCIAVIACVACLIVLKSDNVEDPLDGISLEVKENTVSKTGFTLIMRNVSPNDYVYSGVYEIEQKVNDRWEPVPVIPYPFGWVSTSNVLNGNSVTELEIDWEWLYGELSLGSYRITKTFALSLSPDNYDITGENYPLTVEFTIDFGIMGAY
jgi:hypothetical protein